MLFSITCVMNAELLSNNFGDFYVDSYVVHFL